MDKRKKVLKSLFFCILILLIIAFLYSLIIVIRTGKQEIIVTTNTNYYSGSNINAIVEVKKYAYYSKETIKAKIKAELLDENEKIVKEVKPFLGTVQKNEKISLEMKLPDELENSKYYLKLTSKSGLLKDEFKIPINIKSNKNSNAIISLDKGIYRPGDEINYRVLLLSKNDDNPEENEIEVSIYDGNDNKVYTVKSKTSEFGISSGKFVLADEVNSGSYKLIVNYGSKEFVKNFNVNPYITPKFEVSVTTDKDTYIIGEKANITVNAKYFFGEAVQNAEVVIKIDDEEIKGLTDSFGNFTAEYEITENKEYNFNTEVTDSSNYLIETNKTLYGATDKFEIELLPEYGSIVRDIDNNIYVVTKKASGDPIKTINKIKVGDIKRDVITDESGMKYFTLTSADISTLKTDYKYNSNYGDYANNYYSQNINFEIISTDNEGNSVTKSIPLEISKSKVVLITDKNKYNENDDITITVEGGTEWINKELFVCKGEELLKSVRIEDNTVKINLENCSGLIDFYLNSKDGYSEFTKKTIFIRPSKQLLVNIKTDSEEYSPKDKLNLEITTENEEGNKAESALLVSILDESILSIENNDLSIDNIKVALGDIVFSDGITAADLYAEILDDSSTYKLDTMLLKQNNSNMNYLSNSYNNHYNEEDNIRNSFILGIIVVILAFIYFIRKSEKIRNIVVGLLIILNMATLLFISTYEILDYEVTYDYVAIFVGWFITSLLSYILLLKKYRNYLIKLILVLEIIPSVWMLIFGIISEIIYSETTIIILIFFGIICWIILKIADNNKKLGKKVGFIKDVLGNSIRAMLFWLAVYYFSDKTHFVIPIVLTIYILLDVYIFNTVKKDEKAKMIKDGKIIIDSSIILIIIFIIIFFALVGIFSTFRNFASPANRLEDNINYEIRENKTINESFTNVYDGATDSSSASELIRPRGMFSSMANSIENIHDSGKTNETDYEYVEETEVIESSQDTINNTTEIEKEENVRNIFLESLVFIPELITNEGKAETQIDISDNITTWNIQVVGNTKDGRLGSNSKTFKVFKEFFVDFSLPRNSVIGDYVEIPVTVYNYTENDLQVELNVVQNEWARIGEYEKNINVSAKGSSLVYVPLDILKNGNNKFRVECRANGVSDVVEKSLNVNFNGLEKTMVEASGSIEKDFVQDIIFNEKGVEGSKKLKVRLYPSPASEIISGMESMLSLPSGCFEQTSSSLYPDILILKYLKENNLDNEEIRNTALDYISKGYQKLLTYEVTGEKGGYSLYGNSPAEPVITAFGLMEFKELLDVYEVDEKVINNMKEYLYKNQKVSGEFDYSSTYIGGSSSTDKYAMNAYIIWALSEADPEDSRLSKSISYLEDSLDKITDNYTLALIANVFANTSNKKVDEVIKTLSKNIKVEENYSYLTSDIRDYYGSYGEYQNIQATALTSIALSKLNKDSKANGELIKYIINSRGSYGNWGTTQASILALKAINAYNKKGKIKDQTIIVNVNGKEQSFEVKENSLDIYELTFDDIKDENTVQIKMKDGKINYEIVKEYYEEYASIGLKDKIDIAVSQTLNASLNVNDVLTQNIEIANMSEENIENAIVRINIPQGASVIEDSLLEMKYEGKIEKYEYNYGSINIYLRNFARENLVNLQVRYRSLYPEKVTGGAIRVYDYYNPEIEGITSPVEITVNK